VTGIGGGTASNIVPVSCSFGFEVRALPGTDLAGIEQRLVNFAGLSCLPEMHRVAPEARIDIRQTNQVPPFAADPASEVVSLVMALAQQNTTFAVSYATEAGLLADEVSCDVG